MSKETSRLEADFFQACAEVGIKEEDRLAVCSLMSPLRDKNNITHAHHQHSLRVALLARKIGQHTNHEEKPLLFAGALHDIGKALVPNKVLGKTGAYDKNDYRIMRKHVMDSYRMLRDRFDFTAEIILWHHRFQQRGYPKVLPTPLHPYDNPSKLLIIEYGRLLSIADVYDALHRKNDKFKEGGGLSGEEVKQKMFEFNPDRKKLVEALYYHDVFTV